MARSPVRSRPGGVSASLARNRLGVASVVFFVVAAAAPLTVIAGAVTTGYAVAGFGGISVAFVTVMLMLLVFAAGFVAMSRRIVNAGAFYTYVAQGLGRPAGVSAAWVALAAYNLMQIGILGGFGLVASLVLDVAAGIHVPWFLCALAGWLLIGLLGVLRVDLNGRVLAVLLVGEIAVALVFDVTLLTHPFGGQVDFSPLAPGWLLVPGGLAACVGAIASFVGFESTVVFAEETKDPRRTVPRATYLAILLVGAVYALSAWALPVAVGAANVQAAAQQEGTELMFNLVLPYLGQSVVDLGHLLLLTSLFAAALAFHNVVARYLFALGRERVLWAGLGRASRAGAPKWGSLTQTTLALLALAVAWWLDADPAVHLLFRLTVVGGFGVLLLMAATSLSVLVFFHRDHGGESVWRRRLAPGAATLVLTGVGAGSVAQFHILLGVDESSPLKWVFPAAFGVVALLGLVWAGVLRARRPEVYRAVGLGAHSVDVTTATVPPSRPVAQPTTYLSGSQVDAGRAATAGDSADAQPRLNQPPRQPVGKETRR